MACSEVSAKPAFFPRVGVFYQDGRLGLFLPDCLLGSVKVVWIFWGKASCPNIRVYGSC